MSRADLARKIKALRQERAWTQVQLAEITRLSLRTIQRVEKTGCCSAESLLALSAAFDLEIQTLTTLKKAEIKDAVLSPANSPWQQGANRNRVKGAGRRHSHSKWWEKVSVWVGLVLITPAFYFVVANVLKYSFGIAFLATPLDYFYANSSRFRIFNTVSPIVFLTGLSAALVLNSAAILRLRWFREPDEIVSILKLKTRLHNLLVAGFSLMLLALLLLYAFLENFG